MNLRASLNSGKPFDLSKPPFLRLENPLPPAQAASPGGAPRSVVVSKRPLSQGSMRGRAATSLLKSQPLTQAAASHRQNGADDALVYLTGLPGEAKAAACATALGEPRGACPGRWPCRSHKIASGRAGRARPRADIISRSRTGSREDTWGQDQGGACGRGQLCPQSLAQGSAKYTVGAQSVCVGLMPE